MITIGNMRGRNWPTEPWQVRCDRAGVLGNPFGMHRIGDRDKSCDSYDARFQVVINRETARYKTFGLTEEDVEAIHSALTFLRALYKTHGKLELMCWCAPLRCHTQTIKTWLEGVV